MPDNQAGQRDEDVVAYASFSGLRNSVDPERFTQSDLARADNIDHDETGRISRRDGYSLIDPLTSHSLWADAKGDTCLFAQGNVLYSLNPDFTKQPLATLTSDQRISFEKVNDRVYFSNGVDAGVIEQGAVRSWGVAPPTLPTVALGLGSMPAGTYQFTMTYMRNDMQESGAPTAGLIDVPTDGAALVFTQLPVSRDPAVTGKNVYLSPPNGEQMFLALSLANASLSATYADDTSELNLPLDTQFLTQAPAGQLVAYYRGSVFVAVGDLLYPSQPFAHEQFDPRDYIQMDGRITVLGAVTDKELYESGKNSGFFIGTDRSCGVLVGSSLKDFQYVPKTRYGAVFGSMALVDGSLFEDGSAGARDLPMWLTTQGICVGMADLTIKNLTRTRYGFDTGGEGGALFMPGLNRYIATSNF